MSRKAMDRIWSHWLSGRPSRRHGVRDNTAAEILEPREVLSGNGLTVVLDPGHGIGNAAGGTTGVESRVTERELTLDMARRMQGMLQNWGFNVTLTRNNDYDVDFYTRSHTAQQVGADFFLSLHFDGRSDGSRGTIAEVMQSNVNLADDVTFADIVRTATLLSYTQPSDGRTRITDERTGVLSDTALGNTSANHPVVSALLEIEALSNIDVDRFFNSTDPATREANRNRVAFYIAYGILDAKQAMFDYARVTAPASLQATAVSSSQVNLTWADVANETGYRIYRGDGALVATVGANTTTYQVSGLAAGQTQALRVEAFNAVNSASTGWQFVTTPSNRVTAPSWLTLNAVSSSQVNVSWADVADEDGYRVYRGDGALVATVGANATTYQVSGLTAGQTQRFRVEAFNAVNSASTGWQSVVTPSLRVTTPAWLSVSAGGNSRANLYWADAANETGYRIYHAENGRAVLIRTVGSNTTFFQTGAFARNQYHAFLVEAFNSSSSAYTSWQWVWIS